jgi:hypothetical protein
MIQSSNRKDVSLPPPVPVIALAAWFLPGLGYLLIGERWRGVVAGLTIVALFVLGILIGGVRVIDVPGYDFDGNRRRTPAGWQLRSEPFAAVMSKPFYVPQILAGLPTIGSTIWSLEVSGTVQKTRARLGDIGTLYTAVAGMLNLLILIDSAHRATRVREELMNRFPHLIG